MKNLFLLALAAVVVSSCGAVAADLAMISCTSPSRTTVTVSVDNRDYNVRTSVSKTYSTSKKAKKSSKKVSAQPAPSQPAPSQPAAQQPQVNQSDRKTTTSRTSSTSRSTTNSSSRRSLTNTDESSSSRTTKTISVEAGEHDVKVTDQQGNEVYSGRVGLSSSEHKVIELQ